MFSLGNSKQIVKMWLGFFLGLLLKHERREINRKTAVCDLRKSKVIRTHIP